MMNRATTMGAMLAALSMHSGALGAYTGISVERHTTVTIEGQGYDVYRVYANFNNPNDRLVVVFGSPTFGTLSLETRNSTDSGPGSALYNHSGGGTTAPTAAWISVAPDVQWDSFVTLGVSIRDQATPNDHTTLTPGFPFFGGTQMAMNNAAWYAPPTIDHDGNPGTPPVPPPQTLAGFAGDGDLANRVMMMQMTVQAGEHVRGIVNIGWYHPLGGPFQQVNQVPLQSFNSFLVPAPSALALLGLAGVVAVRRRRRN